MPKLLFLSPMVPCTDLDGAAAFLEAALGFRVVFVTETYRVCERDGLTLHLQQAGEGTGPVAVYLEVDDLEAVWQAARPHLAGLRHREPFEQPYRMREFHVDLPHTQCLLFVGESLP